jgi:hypothetical protein
LEWEGIGFLFGVVGRSAVWVRKRKEERREREIKREEVEEKKRMKDRWRREVKKRK